MLSIEGGDRDVHRLRARRRRRGDRADAHPRRQAAGARASVPRERRGRDRRARCSRRISPGSYLPLEDRAAELLVPFDPDERELVEASLERTKIHRAAARAAARAGRPRGRRTRGICSRSCGSPARRRRSARAIPIYELQRQLGLQKVPRALVCFDISHAQGTDTVASCVWFQNGRPYRAEYRKFKVKTVEGIDDFASMHEVVDALFHAPARRGASASRSRLDRRRQGSAQRGARGAATRSASARCRSSASPSARKRSSSSGAPSRCGCRAGRPRCACCSRRATRPIASRSRSSASVVRCVRSRRSCCGSRASAKRSGASCSRHSAACRAFATRRRKRSPRCRASVARRRTASSTRCSAVRRPPRRRGADGRSRAGSRPNLEAVSAHRRPLVRHHVSTWHLECSCVRHARAGDARATVCPQVRAALSRHLRFAHAAARRDDRAVGHVALRARDAARSRRGAGVARRRPHADAASCRSWRARSAWRGSGSRTRGSIPTASFKARGMSAAVTRARGLGVSGLVVPTAGNAGAALTRVRRRRRLARARLRAGDARPSRFSTRFARSAPTCSS